MVVPIDQSRFDDVISRVPALADAGDLDVRQLEGGLTNTSYLVTAVGEQYVVRIVGDNGQILVGDRTIEESAMRRAVEAGISPELVVFVQPEGHIVTRYLVDARPLTIEEFTSPEMVPRLAERPKRVHGLSSPQIHATKPSRWQKDARSSRVAVQSRSSNSWRSDLRVPGAGEFPVPGTTTSGLIGLSVPGKEPVCVVAGPGALGVL